MVLEALLEKYAEDGVQSIAGMKVLRVKPLDYFGTPVEIVNVFGGRKAYDHAVN